ncbi:MAG: hypothetical protein D6773_08510 [Alphaproteobacteria bacterium]|nr:MAG: hypothetical protein D6773_08510 [Alphaproteobacteria bacterium]
MGARGRKSSQDIEISPVGPVEAVARPDAPYDLADAEAEVWWSVVNRMPADWFGAETHPLLTQYCRHVVTAREIAGLIRSMREDGEGFDLVEYDRLLKMQERESRQIVNLATKMRISQQALINHRGNKKRIGAKKPWQA